MILMHMHTGMSGEHSRQCIVLKVEKMAVSSSDYVETGEVTGEFKVPGDIREYVFYTHVAVKDVQQIIEYGCYVIKTNCEMGRPKNVRFNGDDSKQLRTGVHFDWLQVRVNLHLNWMSEDGSQSQLDELNKLFTNFKPEQRYFQDVKLSTVLKTLLD